MTGETAADAERRGGLAASPVDLALAFAGWFLICFVPIGRAATSLGDPLAWSPLTPAGLAALVALPLAAGYLHRGGSLDDLGSFVLVGTAVLWAIGLPATLLQGALDAAPPTESTAAVVTNTAFFAVVYAVTYWLVYRGGLATFRSS